MPKYFTHLVFGEPHEPKTLITAHHSYHQDGRNQVINVFGFTAEKQDKSGVFKVLKSYSEDAVIIALKAHFYVFGVDNAQTEKY